MVGGVHGYLVCAVRLVVVECRNLLENATIPDLHVEGVIAVVLIPMRRHVTTFAVEVRS